MEVIRKNFPELTYAQVGKLAEYEALLSEWNAKLNLVSRQDIVHFEVRHLLYSLSIARWIRFLPGSAVLDLGTGGGLPGIPLAIFFGDVHFTLIDGTGKKIKAVEAMIRALGLANAAAQHIRAEEMEGSFDFIVIRAVAPLKQLVRWCSPLISAESRHPVPNGIIALKGGALTGEIKSLGSKWQATHFSLKGMFDETYFDEKHLVHICTPPQ